MAINLDKNTLIAHFSTQTFASSITLNTEHNLAAVLIPIIDESGELQVLFTQRTTHLKHHAGQISFPGGRMELSDSTLIDTALREAYEEIGLKQSQIQLLGRLNPLLSSTQFFVTPFIGLITPPLHLIIDPYEVSEIFTVPLSFLLDPNNQQKQIYTQDSQSREIYVIEYDKYRIWGLTAQIIVTITNQLIKKR